MTTTRTLPLAGLIAVALVGPAVAQQWPNLSPDDEISPRQVQTVPAAKPKARNSHAADPGDGPATTATVTPASRTTAGPKGAPVGNTVGCSGLFAKDSSHVKLAQAVGPNSIEFGEVSGGGGGAINASILYGKDPKRRLEVVWQNEAARSDTSIIVITGQSQWHGPKGVRLGLALPALEKLNGKPFKLSGFDQPDGSSAIDWQGGALASLPGGCQIGVKFAADPKAAPDAVTAAAGKEFLSSDAAIRAVKPTVAEIIIGY